MRDMLMTWYRLFAFVDTCLSDAVSFVYAVKFDVDRLVSVDLISLQLHLADVTWSMTPSW